MSADQAPATPVVPSEEEVFIKKVSDVLSRSRAMQVQGTKVILTPEDEVRDERIRDALHPQHYQAIYNALYNAHKDAKDADQKLTEIRGLINVSALIYLGHQTQADEVAATTLKEVADKYAQKNIIQAWRVIKGQIANALYLVKNVPRGVSGEWLRGSLAERIDHIYKIVEKNPEAKNQINLLHSIVCDKLGMILNKNDPAGWGIRSVY